MENQKHLFSLREGVHYLNCAYKAPLLKSAEEAAHQELIKMRTPEDLLPADYFDDVEKARELFAQLVHCDASEVAIVPSTSYAFTSV